MAFVRTALSPNRPVRQSPLKLYIWHLCPKRCGEEKIIVKAIYIHKCVLVCLIWMTEKFVYQDLRSTCAFNLCNPTCVSTAKECFHSKFTFSKVSGCQSIQAKSKKGSSLLVTRWWDEDPADRRRGWTHREAAAGCVFSAVVCLQFIPVSGQSCYLDGRESPDWDSFSTQLLTHYLLCFRDLELFAGVGSSCRRFWVDCPLPEFKQWTKWSTLLQNTLRLQLMNFFVD